MQVQTTLLHFCNCGKIQTWFTANNYPVATVSDSVTVLSKPYQTEKWTTFLFYVCTQQQIIDVKSHLCKSACRIFLTAMLTRPNTQPTLMYVNSDAELMIH
jgi:hypothetical protein